MLKKLFNRLPEWARQPAVMARARVRRVLYHGKARWCPVCEKTSRKFLKFGLVPRKEARCVHCGALERHRLIWLFFKRRTNLFDAKPKTVLHVAPEECLEARLRNHLGDHYITADLLDPGAMIKMDIADIQYPDNHFDVIYCSHVLEHVPDDRRAMREFFRVLKPDGWAILLVPVTSDKTFEDPSITDPPERLKVFGQEDHVRRYGPDYVDRLREAGFDVEISRASDMFDEEDILRMGLTPAGGEIYYCTKAS